MLVLCLVLAVIAAVAGLLFLSQATVGVGLLALACLLGIFGRIAQAHAHQPRPTPTFTGDPAMNYRTGTPREP